MGDIKRKRRLYAKPRKLFDRARIDEENVIVRQYGLKNKREIWKVKSLVSKFRRQAKSLIGHADDQKVFIAKLNKMGIAVESVADVLALQEQDLLNRRLQTFVVKKKLASTPKQARQLIVHKHVIVDGTIVNIPSFWVTKDLENKIEIKPFKEKPIKEEPKENETQSEESTQENTEEKSE